MMKRNKTLLSAPCFLGLFLAAFLGAAWAEDVPSAETIRSNLSRSAAIPESTESDRPIGTMGVAQRTRPASEEQGKGMIDLQIPFPLNQYLISPQAAPYLEALGNALSHEDLRGYVFEIQGHTCDLGSDEYNLKLSQQRAIAVREYLVRYFRLSPAQIRAVGYGEGQPVGDNTTDDGKARNRRVTVVNTFQPFSEKDIPISVKSRVTYRRGRETSELQPGESLTARDDYAVSFNANERCHVYIFQIGADSSVVQLFPNSSYHQKTNPVEAGAQYRVPDRPDQWLYLDDNKGDEEIVILASSTDLNEPKKVCLKVVGGTTLLAQHVPSEVKKPIHTMGPKGTRTVEEQSTREPLPPPGPVSSIPEGLFTWRFPFRHQ